MSQLNNINYFYSNYIRCLCWRLRFRWFCADRVHSFNLLNSHHYSINGVNFQGQSPPRLRRLQSKANNSSWLIMPTTAKKKCIKRKYLGTTIIVIFFVKYISTCIHEVMPIAFEYFYTSDMKDRKILNKQTIMIYFKKIAVQKNISNYKD